MSAPTRRDAGALGQRGGGKGAAIQSGPIAECTQATQGIIITTARSRPQAALQRYGSIREG